MRLVISLFSVWLLLLSGLPCPDAECHAHENRAAATSPSHPADDHDHGHKAPCSPFCHCATCLGFSTPQPFRYYVPIELPESSPARQVFTYLSPSHADVTSGIWQPPKLRT
ncbi:hypothetical protein IC229_11435 [Spirosoma sp. BT702]|uniref:DUF2946 domain-containing protein n=1 Tax=Spirosoma profusum TaxID=2771354 RepID=A0A926XZS0_9BACT|nr:DUF6660 family protein [Spirosoma profusum]MBD2701252.1 hypothetical protein [Spirosoma profusum]